MRLARHSGYASPPADRVLPACTQRLLVSRHPASPLPHLAGYPFLLPQRAHRALTRVISTKLSRRFRRAISVTEQIAGRIIVSHVRSSNVQTWRCSISEPRRSPVLASRVRPAQEVGWYQTSTFTGEGTLVDHLSSLHHPRARDLYCSSSRMYREVSAQSTLEGTTVAGE